jgi:sigma-B regulation protein RsbU (phosphoserine phosphatase)
VNAESSAIRERLLAGRAELAAVTRGRPEPQLLKLLDHIDSALREYEDGSWGLCGVCHESISSQQLDEQPLVSICLECLTNEQRDALQRDIESAARVQRALLPPRELSFEGWDIHYLFEPFGAVSGDHVDVLRPPKVGGPLHLLVGDVAGKGLAASLLQAQLHALFRALAPTEETVSGLLTRTNRLFYEATTAACFATLAALRLYPDGRVVLSNAGHPRPLLADRRGVRPIEDASIPLGVVAEASYTERELRLRPGETMLIYTDGWTEAERNGEEYGVGRGSAALRRARGLPTNELLAACRGDLERFLDGVDRGDDITMVAVRRAI